MNVEELAKVVEALCKEHQIPVFVFFCDDGKQTGLSANGHQATLVFHCEALKLQIMGVKPAAKG